ncbi:MAG: RNA polymerase sigma factor [Bacteroidota bacterium]|nr:RNA polymerase sigma factor [Bacteroidota bacterium]
MATLDFSQLVTKYSATLKPFAMSLTHDLDDAKDLIQETVFRALSSEDKYNAGTNLKAWMYTIMKNIFINNYRRKAKRTTILDTTDGQLLINNSSNNEANYGETSSMLNDLYKEINKLEYDYKMPFLLHFNGFKYHEIAENLNVPIGTVKSRIHCARKELKRNISKF